MTDFRIMLADEHLTDGVPEERAAFGHLTMYAGPILLSEGFDNLVELRRDGPLVSGYPMAEWLLWNWWRLRYESRPSGPVASGWRQSHCLAEIGSGYVWPNVTIVSDGQRTMIHSGPSVRGAISSFRYYGAPQPVLLPWSEVERGIDDFVSAIMARTAAAGVSDTNLDRLWRDLSAERRDPEAARFRRFEALLGVDPDEVPEEAIARRLADGAALGEQAIDELAAAAGGLGINAVMSAEQAHETAETYGVELRTDDALRLERPAEAPPWIGVQPNRGENGFFLHVEARQTAIERVDLTPTEEMLAADLGVAAAHVARRRAGLRGGVIGDQRLAEIAGVSHSALRASPQTLPISFTLREDGASARIVLRGKRAENRRFDLARLIGDRLIWDSQPMRPSTDARTYRQKAQRAFAAEFLAPIDAVKARAEGDYSDDAKEDVARHFRVSPMVIDRLLKNNGVIPRDAGDFADVA